MRHFNKREKEIIEILVNRDFKTVNSFSAELNKMLFNEKNGAALMVDRAEKIVYLFIYNFEDEKCVKSRIGEFLELINLLLYLDENNLINILPQSNLPEFFLLHDTFRLVDYDSGGKCILNGNGFSFDVGDMHYIYNREGIPVYRSYRFNGKYYDLALRFFFGVIYPTAELCAFVERGNITEEEERFNIQLEESLRQHRIAMENAGEQLRKTKRSLNISYIALFISFVALIATLCSNLWMKTTIEPGQFRIMENFLERIEKNTGNENIRTDTIVLSGSAVQTREDSLNIGMKK